MDDVTAPFLHVSGGARRPPLGRATFVASDSDSSFTEEDDNAVVELSGHVSSAGGPQSISCASSVCRPEPQSCISRSRVASLVSQNRPSALATSSCGPSEPAVTEECGNVPGPLSRFAERSTRGAGEVPGGPPRSRAEVLCSTEEVGTMAHQPAAAALRRGPSSWFMSLVLGNSTAVPPPEGSPTREEDACARPAAGAGSAVDLAVAANPPLTVQPLTSFEEVQRSANAVRRQAEPQEETIEFRHGTPSFVGDVVVPCFEAGDGVLYLLGDRATGRRAYFNDSCTDAMEVRFVVSAKSRISPLGNVRMTVDELRGRLSGGVVIPAGATEMVWVGHVEGEQMKYCVHRPTPCATHRTVRGYEVY